MSGEAHRRPALLQISVSQSVEKKQLVPAYQTFLEQRAQELEEIRRKWAPDLVTMDGVSQTMGRLSPHAVAVTEAKLEQLETLHLLLSRALVDVVERWFSDEDARLPQRMPLEPHEEKLLRWVGDGGIVPPYVDHAGIWRSDVLFGRSRNNPDDDEAPYICEINGRLPLNGVCRMGLLARGVRALGTGKGGVESLNSLEESVERATSFFDQSKPLFCIRDKWGGEETKIFLPLYADATRQPVATVRPQDLEVRPDAGSPTGYALWDAATDTLLEQWVCELLQEEWATLDEAVARQVATTPVNDFRTTLLVHDKRLLSIIPEEVPGMVARGVLSADEGQVITNSIPETIISGSEAVRALLQKSLADPTLKDGYIWKSCRDGYGLGIELGHEIAQDDWLERLKRFAEAAVRPMDGAAVIQKLVDHHWYDVVRHELPGTLGIEPSKVHLIGSFFMFQNKGFYPGPWRTGQEKHLGLGPGGTGIVMGGVRVPDWPLSEGS